MELQEDSCGDISSVWTSSATETVEISHLQMNTEKPAYLHPSGKNNDSLLHIAFRPAVRRRYCHCLCHPPPVKQTLVTALTPPCLLRHAHRAALSHCHSSGPKRVRGENICSCAFLFDRPLVWNHSIFPAWSKAADSEYIKCEVCDQYANISSTWSWIISAPFEPKS